MRIKKQIYFLFFVLISQFGFGQNIQIKATIDTNRILIGDPVNYTLEVTKPKDLNLAFPIFAGDTITEKIEIIQTNTIDTISSNNNNITLAQNYIISCYDSGSFEIPPQPFVYKNDTTTDTIYSQPLVLNSQTLLVDTSKKDIKDIKAPINTPFSFQEFLKYYLPYFLGGIILLVILYFLYKYYKKRKQLQQTKPKKVYVPKEAAHIIAIRKLDELKEKKLWQNSLIKQYYIELTEILRNYLDDRFRFNAMEKTTFEITFEIKEQKIFEQTELNLLSYILEYGDLAKFARYNPLPDENDKCLKNAYEFVNDTQLTETDTEDTKPENKLTEEGEHNNVE